MTNRQGNRTVRQEDTTGRQINNMTNQQGDRLVRQENMTNR